MSFGPVMFIEDFFFMSPTKVDGDISVLVCILLTLKFMHAMMLSGLFVEDFS